MVTQLTEGLKKAGLEPTVIDIKPFALLRSLKGSLQGERFNRTTIFDDKYTEEGEIGAILEIGASSSTVTLVRGERVVMNRNLGVSPGTTLPAPCNARSVWTSIPLKRSKSTTAAPSCPAKPKTALSTDVHNERFSPVRVHEALRPTLSDLTTEIRRSLEFFPGSVGGRERDPDVPLGRRLQTCAGLDEAISRSLGFKVEFGNPWLSIMQGDRLRRGLSGKSIAPEFGVPLGLALRGAIGLD